MKLSADQEKVYWEFCEGGGIAPLAERGKVRVKGEDRISFLQALTTNDVEALSSGQGQYNALLTAGGKVVATFLLHRSEDSILLDLDADVAPQLVETLGQFVIMEEVELEDESRMWTHLFLQGEKACEIARSFLGRPLPTGQLQSCYMDDPETIQVVRRSWIGGDGYDLLFPALGSTASEFLSLCLDNECAVLTPDAIEVLRVENAIPRLGVDMDGTTNPLEAGIKDAISFTKGCYIGQEVVAKATYVGGVPRRLCCLVLSGAEMAPVGSEIRGEKEKSVGRVTSSVYSPRLDSPIALAYLRRGVAEKGDLLTVHNSLGEPVSARVVEAFLD